MLFKKKLTIVDYKKKKEEKLNNKLEDEKVVEKEIKPVNTQLSDLSKKIKKTKKFWDNKYELINVQFPLEIQGDKFKKRYKLNLSYKDHTGKLHKKTIRFGNKMIKEFIDDGDDNKKKKISGKLGNTHNIFHGNFWRLHLLNGDSRNLKENYLNLVSKLN
jgi:hypothetical protein